MYVYTQKYATLQKLYCAHKVAKLWLSQHLKELLHCMCSWGIGWAVFKLWGHVYSMQTSLLHYFSNTGFGYREKSIHLLTLPIYSEYRMDMPFLLWCRGGQMRRWTLHSPLPSSSNLATEKWPEPSLMLM